MRTGFRVFLFFMFLLVGAEARAIEIQAATAPGMQQLEGAEITCDQADTFYQLPHPPGTPDPNKLDPCQQCKSAVQQQKDRVKAAREAAIRKNAAAERDGRLGSEKFGENAGSQQKQTQNSANALHGAGTATQAARAQIASALKLAADQCSQQIESSCGGALSAADSQAKQQAEQGCKQIASASQATAAEKTASGSMMDNLGQLASALGQALGAMPQQQPESEQATPPSGITDTPYDPYKSTDTAYSDVEGAKNPAATNLSDKNSSTKGVTIGAPNSGGASVGSGGSGSAPEFQAGNGASSYGADESQTYMDETLAGAGGSSGATVGASVASGGGLGTGGSNATGASRMKAEDAAAAAEAGEPGAFEIPMSGGGGKPAFLGLRSGASELGEFAEGMEGSESSAAELGELAPDEEGERSLASLEEAGISQGEEGTSLFGMVRAKYVEIKKRGNI